MTAPSSRAKFSRMVRPSQAAREIWEGHDGKSNQHPELSVGSDLNIVGRYHDPPCQD